MDEPIDCRTGSAPRAGLDACPQEKAGARQKKVSGRSPPTRRDGYGWILLLVGVFLLPTNLVRAQSPPHADAHVSADSVKIGERFTVTLVAEHAAGTNVVFPTLKAGSALFGELDLLRRQSRGERTESGARQVDSVAYEVTTFALDSARVPVLPVRVVDGRDTTILGTTPDLVSVVSVVPPDAKGLRAPAALISFPRPIWLWVALALGAMVLLGGAAYAWRRWRRADSSASPDEEAQDPYEAASTRLQHLKRRNPNDRATCKAFYIDLTEALRLYLVRRMDIQALERTTPEVVEALHRHPEVPEAAVRRLRAVLEWADFVKFAGAQPEPAESQTVLEKARNVLSVLEAAQRRTEDQTPSDKAPSPAQS